MNGATTQEHAMRKCLRGYAKDKDGNLSLAGTMSIPHSKDKPCPRERKDKRDLVRRGATVFKKENGRLVAFDLGPVPVLLDHMALRAVLQSFS